MPALSSQSPDDFALRLATMHRHLHGLELALDALERDLLALHASQPDGERAAQAAREVMYRQGPQEVKLIHD